MLHRPRSGLHVSHAEKVRTCVLPVPAPAPDDAGGEHADVHTAKCFAAAESLSDLLKLPVPGAGAGLAAAASTPWRLQQQRTPFLTCCVVMAAVVHLAFWSYLVPDGQDEYVKALIRLDVGVLEALTPTWPVAAMVLGQVRGVAHTLWSAKRTLALHAWHALDAAADDVLRRVISDGRHQPVDSFRQLLTP